MEALLVELTAVLFPTVYVLFFLGTLGVLAFADSVRFVPRSSSPSTPIDRNVLDCDAALVLSRDGEVVEGYEAYRRLLGRFGLLAPIARIMGLSPVRAVGTRIYERLVPDRRRQAPDAPSGERP